MTCIYFLRLLAFFSFCPGVCFSFISLLIRDLDVDFIFQVQFFSSERDLLFCAITPTDCCNWIKSNLIIAILVKFCGTGTVGTVCKYIHKLIWINSMYYSFWHKFISQAVIVVFFLKIELTCSSTGQPLSSKSFCEDSPKPSRAAQSTIRIPTLAGNIARTVIVVI